jgi:alpha-tubulin suppressor-like RCC1 family protein
MRTRRWAATAFLLVACHRDKDSYIVVHNDVNCDVPRVYQLRITITNNEVSDQKMIPPILSGELGFPSSIVLDLPSSRNGSFDLVIEAINNKYQFVGQGKASGTIASGERIDLQVQITAAKTTGPTTVVEPGIDGGSLPDGASNPKSDLALGSSVSFVQVSAGGSSTCAVRSDTSLWCWGKNDDGQLRLSGASDRSTPTEIQGLSWIAVSSAQTHACGVRSDGSLACWGDNTTRQLGGATTSKANAQVEVPNGPWQSVSAGSYHTCAIKPDTTLWCWGDNTNGQLGTGNTVASPDPVQIGGTGWVQISGTYLHTCGLKQDTTLWCWGLSADLQLGTTMPVVMSPTRVPGNPWLKVSTGLNHTCGLKQDGTLWCWGGNYKGQLGNAGIPAQDNSKTSDALQVDGSWMDVSAGETYTCGIQSDRSLWCWGDGQLGQLGDGMETQRSTPVAVASAGQTWQAVSAGQQHTCAVATDGSLWCWGNNSNGQLGTGSTQWRQVPTRVVQ